jgi:hypothetical protein
MLIQIRRGEGEVGVVSRYKKKNYVYKNQRMGTHPSKVQGKQEHKKTQPKKKN